MSLRERKKQATAAQILATARELFLRQGYTETAVEQIAEGAGISRASLFNYYRGKGAILDAMAMNLETRLVQLVDHYSRNSDSAACIEQLFAYTARVLEQTADLTRLLFVHGSGGRGFPELQGAFKALVVAGQRRGELRTDCGAEQLAEPLYLGFVVGLLGWCRNPDASLADELSARARLLTLLLQT